MLTAYEKPTYSNHIYANINNRWLQKLRARMPEWSKGADLRSAGFGLVGSNPTPCILLYKSNLIVKMDHTAIMLSFFDIR